MFLIMLMVLFSMTLMIVLALVLLVSGGSNQLVNIITIILAGAVGEYWLKAACEKVDVGYHQNQQQCQPHHHHPVWCCW